MLNVSVCFDAQIADAPRSQGAKVMIFDDNILKFMDCGKAIEGTDLESLVAMGFDEMEKAGAKIWSVSDSPNPAHWTTDVDVGKGLVWEPYFFFLLLTGQELVV